MGRTPLFKIYRMIFIIWNIKSLKSPLKEEKIRFKLMEINHQNFLLQENKICDIFNLLWHPWWKDCHILQCPAKNAIVGVLTFV